METTTGSSRKELTMEKPYIAAMSRRSFLKAGGAAAFGMSALSTNLRAFAALAAEDPKATHNMMVVGEKTIFLSHLPMFGSSDPRKSDFSPHRFQVILEATFVRNGKDVGEIYATDRREHRDTRMYTLQPQPFVLRRLTPADPGTMAPPSFRATVFRDHLERVNPPQVIEGLADVDVKVSNVIHFREFDPAGKKQAQLEYLLFGKGDELFLAHFITRPPDFDQIVSVKVTDHAFTDDELSRGVRITIPGRQNAPSSRIKEGQEAKGETPGAGGAKQSLTLEAGTEFYFEEGELRMPPSFDVTEEERKAGFGAK
jgi:hypothetical protein